jgi:hypothetical protein
MEKIMTVETNVKPTLTTALELIAALTSRVEALEAASAPKTNSSQREMTDEDAKRILTGDLKDMKHKDAASTLGLSYGQIYSCRLEFTFKHIHKAMKLAGTVNPWVK